MLSLFRASYKTFFAQHDRLGAKGTSRGTRGVILLLSRLSSHEKAELRSRRLAFVVVDPRGQPDPDVPTVGATNWSGGLSATPASHRARPPLHRGNRWSPRLALWPCPDGRLPVRYGGGWASREPQAHPLGDFHVDGGFKQAVTLLESPEPPTAIFCGSDLQALGALEAARLRHLRVPTDLSLVGFDDLPLSSWTSPPLTTVRQPLAEMAATAVRLVLAQGRKEEDQKEANRSVELATSLVVRESTAPPRR